MNFVQRWKGGHREMRWTALATGVIKTYPPILSKCSDLQFWYYSLTVDSFEGPNAWLYSLLSRYVVVTLRKVNVVALATKPRLRFASVWFSKKWNATIHNLQPHISEAVDKNHIWIIQQEARLPPWVVCKKGSYFC